jgi:hypothetical protein
MPAQVMPWFDDCPRRGLSLKAAASNHPRPVPITSPTSLSFSSPDFPPAPASLCGGQGVRGGISQHQCQLPETESALKILPPSRIIESPRRITTPILTKQNHRMGQPSGKPGRDRPARPSRRHESKSRAAHTHICGLDTPPPPPRVEGGPAPSWRGLLLGSLWDAWRNYTHGPGKLRATVTPSRRPWWTVNRTALIRP